MLGRILVELQQRVQIVGDLGDRLGVLGAEVDLERLEVASRFRCKSAGVGSCFGG
jgi:hypothetical protein